METCFTSVTVIEGKVDRCGAELMQAFTARSILRCTYLTNMLKVRLSYLTLLGMLIQIQLSSNEKQFLFVRSP